MSDRSLRPQPGQSKKLRQKARRVLLTIEQHGVPVSPGQIWDEYRIGSGGVYIALHALKEAGLVESTWVDSAQSESKQAESATENFLNGWGQETDPSWYRPRRFYQVSTNGKEFLAISSISTSPIKVRRRFGTGNIDGTPEQSQRRFPRSN